MAQYVKKGPFLDNGPTSSVGPYLNAAFFNDLETGLFGATATTATALVGTGIDPTGVTDSTAGINTLLAAVAAGTTVTIPDGTYLLSGTLTIPRAIVLTGNGLLSWTSGIAGSAAIAVNADRTSLRGLRLANTVQPNQTGNKQYGIYISANGCSVTGCLIDGLQQAIAVSPYGEFYDTVIAYNRVFNVPGSGDGGLNLTSSKGEDRGDGIVNWGASCVIANNRVTLAAGSDGRVGIHTEGLSTLTSTAYANQNEQVTIVGNVVSGQFRRSIVSEGVGHTTIADNSVSDATWWGIALIGKAYFSTVTGNTIKWTRTSNDKQGQAYSPRRSGIMVYDEVNSAIIANNTIRAGSGTVITYGISFQYGSDQPQDIHVHHNTIQSSDATMINGINIGSCARPIIDTNLIRGFTGAGVYITNSPTPRVMGNEIVSTGSSSASYGIQVEGSAASARADDNYIQDVGTGILFTSRSGIESAMGNMITNAGTGIDMNGSTGTARASDNLFVNVTTKTANLPTGTITSGNN